MSNINYKGPGCEEYHNQPCCTANIPVCSACQNGQSLEEYCTRAPAIPGCEKFVPDVFKPLCRCHEYKTTKMYIIIFVDRCELTTYKLYSIKTFVTLPLF